LLMVMNVPTIAARVEKKLKEEFIEHSRRNNLAPGSLLRELILQELNKKESITSVYADIHKRFNEMSEKFKAVYGLHLEQLERIISVEMLLISMLDSQLRSQPSANVERLMVLKQIHERDKQDLELVRQKLKNFRREQ